MTKEAYELLKKILSDRVRIYQDSDVSRSQAYQNALDMIEYAQQDNLECLSQFDYN